PVYKMYKDKYFGYHPACWRPFPSGWGCPSPEKPDVEKAFRERKLGTPEGAAPMGAEEGAPGAQPTRPGIPPLPGGARSPFEQPAHNTNKPGNPAKPRDEQKEVSPFDVVPENPPEAAPNAPRAGRTGQPNSTPGDEQPELTSPERPLRVSNAGASRFTPE